MEYLVGEINVQTWAPQSSTETRLYVPPLIEGETEYKKRVYDAEAYDNYFAFHNNVVRSWLNFSINPSIDKDLYDNVKGYCRCYDCVSEAKTWMRYNSLIHEEQSISYYMNMLSENLKQPLLYVYTDKYKKTIMHPHGSILPNELFINKRHLIYKKYKGFSLKHYE